MMELLNSEVKRTDNIPCVSVIIPTYNRAVSLKNAVASVVNQTYDDMEIIIVDDGSTDNSFQSLGDFLHDPRVYYYRRPNSGKPSIARNSGIGLARSEWLSFIDSDDLWIEDKLEKQFRLVNEAVSKGVNLDLVLGDFSTFVEQECIETSFYNRYKVIEKLRDSIHCELSDGWVFEKLGLINALYSRGFAATQAVLVRKCIVKNAGGFDESLTYGEDNDLWMTIAEQGTVGSVNSVVHNYILHKNNITSVKSAKYFEDTIKVLNGHLIVARNNGFITRDLKERLANYKLGLARVHAGGGRTSKALRAMPFPTINNLSIRNLKSGLRVLKAILS